VTAAKYWRLTLPGHVPGKILNDTVIADYELIRTLMPIRLISLVVLFGTHLRNRSLNLCAPRMTLSGFYDSQPQRCVLRFPVEETHVPCGGKPGSTPVHFCK
jgi:hypothetical protein